MPIEREVESVRYDAPPLRSSIFTVDPGLPVYDQLIVWVDPAVQVSPPLGEVTVIDGGAGPVIVKLPSLASLQALFVVLVTLT